MATWGADTSGNTQRRVVVATGFLRLHMEKLDSGSALVNPSSEITWISTDPDYIEIF